MMSLEQKLAAGNSSIFLREFTFSNTKFKRMDGQEVEFCDGAVWIDDLLILYQLKERNPEFDTGDPAKESRWFNKKVEKHAVGQFADTIKYLETEYRLPFQNHRGQTLDFADAKPTNIHLIALFDPSESLPIDLVCKKGRTSKRVGFVHYFPIGDFQAMRTILHTPFEIAEYLDFREEFVQRIPDSNDVSEKAMFWKYLTDSDHDDEISHGHEYVTDQLIDDRDDFNISRLMEVYYDRIVSGNEGTQYHLLLREMAKLTRTMCHEFRKRFEWAKEKCTETTQPMPSRFFPVSQDCAFISIPLPAELRDEWKSQLEFYTMLCKYDLRCAKCVGYTMAVNADDPESYDVNWMCVEFDWERNPEIDKILAEDEWFRSTQGKLIGKYHLK